jgi:hypothetical protein
MLKNILAWIELRMQTILLFNINFADSDKVTRMSNKLCSRQLSPANVQGCDTQGMERRYSHASPE